MSQLTEQTQFTDRQFVYSYWQVNGERNPSDVYKDFRSVVLQMLGMHDQGTEGPAVPANVTLASSVEKVAESMPYKAPAKGFPPVIWVIGECLMRETNCSTADRK
jgi:chitodextrinase